MDPVKVFGVVANLCFLAIGIPFIFLGLRFTYLALRALLEKDSLKELNYLKQLPFQGGFWMSFESPTKFKKRTPLNKLVEVFLIPVGLFWVLIGLVMASGFILY